MSQKTIVKKPKLKKINLNPQKNCFNCVHLKESVKICDQFFPSYTNFPITIKLVKNGELLAFCDRFNFPLFDLKESICSEFNLNKKLSNLIREEKKRIEKMQSDIEYEKHLREDLELELNNTQKRSEQIKHDLKLKHLGKIKALTDQINTLKETIQDRITMFESPLKLVHDTLKHQKLRIKIEEEIKTDYIMKERKKLLEQLELDLQKLMKAETD